MNLKNQDSGRYPARDPEAFIKRVREMNRKYSITALSVDEIRDAINEGRE